MSTTLKAWRPRIVAHRGGAAESGLPENSAAAFARAFQDGFSSECDVHASSDGWPVVFHDETLDRLTWEQGAISNRTAAELQTIRLRSAGLAHATIPLLADVAPHLHLVEIKPEDSPELVRSMIEAMAGQDWRLMAFDVRNLLHAREIDRDVRSVFLADDVEEVELAIAGKWMTYLNHRVLNERLAMRFCEAGISFGVWTVNDEASLDRIAICRPDVIISDWPRLMKRRLEALGVDIER